MQRSDEEAKEVVEKVGDGLIDCWLNDVKLCSCEVISMVRIVMGN